MDSPILLVTNERSGRLRVPKMGELEDVEIRLPPRSIAGYLRSLKIFLLTFFLAQSQPIFLGGYQHSAMASLDQI